MVATALGEKLHIGRRPMRNWTQLQLLFSLFLCELRLIIDVTDVMICSLQSVNVLYLLYLTYLLNFVIPNPFYRLLLVLVMDLDFN